MPESTGLEALVRRFVALERGPGPLEYNRTMTVRGPVAAWLRLTPG